MKQLFLIAALVMFCAPAYAQTAATPATNTVPQAPAPPSSKYTTVNGQKFFLLQNAKHFSGDMSNPGALAVMHHPRSGGAGTAPGAQRKVAPSPNNNNVESWSSTNTSTPAPAPLPPPQNPVLEVFTPPGTPPPDNR